MSEDDVYRADLKRLTSATEALTAELRLLREESIKSRAAMAFLQKESDQHARNIGVLFEKVNSTALQQAGSKPAIDHNKYMIGLLCSALGALAMFLLKG